MIRPGNTARLIRRRALLAGAGLALVGCGLAPTAGAAPPQATLSVKVVPHTVHPVQTYAITITGSYNKATIRTVPYLLAFIDYTGAACQRTVGAEFALPAADWSSDFFSLHPRKGGILERGSPFTRVDHWRAESTFGSRRVCAYLYRHKVSVTTTSAPLVMATATFKNVKR